MKRLVLACLLIVLTYSGFSQKGKVERYGVKDLFTLDIYFPPGYDSLQEYPAIYFNDGESIFGFKSKFDSLINNNHTIGFIVVGIHAGEKRFDKYIPYEDPWIKKNWGDYNPFAAAYSQVVINGVIPFVEERFNVIKSKKGRAIMGYSLGGLHATWIGLNHSEYFSVIGAFSPSYWVANHQIIKEANKKRDDQKLWFDIGTAEWAYYIPMLTTLDTLDWTFGKDLFYYEVPNGAHEFKDWKERVAYPIVLFCGANKDELNPKSLELNVHCIPSQNNPLNVYQRLNPVVTLSNGVKYSALDEVEYKVTKGKADINPDGSYISNGNFKVKYRFGDLTGEKKVSCN